jgi:hypothetical protein
MTNKEDKTKVYSEEESYEVTVNGGDYDTDIKDIQRFVPKDIKRNDTIRL